MLNPEQNAIISLDETFNSLNLCRRSKTTITRLKTNLFLTSA